MTRHPPTALDRGTASALRDGRRLRILVRAPNWIGDVVMSTPGLRALRVAAPDAVITVQARAAHLGLLAGSPDIDQLVPVDSYHAGLPAMVREARRLRAAGPYDLGVCIPDSFSSALLMRLARVARVCGFAGGARAALLHQRVPRPPEWRSADGRRELVARERFVLTLLAGLGVPGQGEDLALTLAAEDTQAFERSEAAAALGGDSAPLVGLAPGAAYGPAKCWPAERFAEVGDALAAAGARVVLIGAPSERPVAARVVAAMHAPCVDLVGRMGLGAAKVLISRFALLVCNDAGARHIAAAFGVPSLVFFGPTSVAKTDCNLEAVSIFERDEPCRPCYRRVCPIEHPCLKGIAAEPVIARAREILDAAHAPNRVTRPARA